MSFWRNSESTGLWAGLILIAAGGLLILLPPLAGLDGMDGGFALQFGGFFLAVVGLVTAAMFGYRSRRLCALLTGQNVLAHWVYDAGQVRAQADRDLEAARTRNRVQLLVLSMFMVACIVLFTVIGYASGEGDNMPAFVGLMLGVLLIVAAAALGLPYLAHRRAVRSGGEVYIAASALYVNGALHTWGDRLSSLDDVSLVADPPRLVFCLRAHSVSGPGEAYTVEVPVPPGRESSAQHLAARLKGHS